MSPTPAILPPPADSSCLGARLRGDGAQFGLWSPRATRVELVLIGEDKGQRNVDLSRGHDGVWTGHVRGVVAGQRYGYRVHGGWAPHSGARFNPAKLLLDPYARAITGGVDYRGPILDHTEASDYEPDPRDSFNAVPLGVVVADTPPPVPLAAPVPMAETVLVRAARQGVHPAASGRARAPARQLCRSGLPRGDRAPQGARRHLGRAAAGAPLRLRAVPDPPRPVQLLGLQHPGLLRPARRVRLASAPSASRSPSSRTWCRPCTRRASR